MVLCWLVMSEMIMNFLAFVFAKCTALERRMGRGDRGKGNYELLHIDNDNCRCRLVQSENPVVLDLKLELGLGIQRRRIGLLRGGDIGRSIRSV